MVRSLLSGFFRIALCAGTTRQILSLVVMVLGGGVGVIFRSVGPMCDRDYELREMLGWIGNRDDGGAGQIRSPDYGVGVRVEKHEMGGPVRGDVAAVPLVPHHVAHGSGFHGRQFFFGEGSGD